ncbi:hypothetical protein WEB32_30285 [Streptomyces netropsis]|uniref:hypothetical protein n=1 Tax=Streptomyces netropsis TaxID=55404 RepID=UPI0030CE808A
MGTVRRFAATVTTTALLTLVSITLASPAQAADGVLEDKVNNLLFIAGQLIDNVLNIAAIASVTLPAVTLFSESS